MKTLRDSNFVRVLLPILIIVPAVSVAYFQGRIKRYSNLLAQYECRTESCVIDLSKHGRLGRVFIDHRNPADGFDSWFVAEDSGRELLRVPRRFLDDSLQLI